MHLYTNLPSKNQYCCPVSNMSQGYHNFCILVDFLVHLVTNFKCDVAIYLLSSGDSTQSLIEFLESINYPLSMATSCSGVPHITLRGLTFLLDSNFTSLDSQLYNRDLFKNHIIVVKKPITHGLTETIVAPTSPYYQITSTSNISHNPKVSLLK